MKHITASLIAIAVAVVAISIGITVYASVYSPTPEPEVNSLSSRAGIGGYHDTPEEYVLNTTLPSVPDKLMVHRTKKPNVTREEVAALAERLGMNGSVREVDGMFFVTDGPFFLQVSNYSGAIMYVHTTVPERRDKDKPENLPSDEEAVEIARIFLEERGLMPEDAFFHKVRHEVVISTRKGEIVADKIMVGFDRNINDIPLDGAGITVGVGGYGEVIELWKLWRESEPYKEYSIITPEEAFEVLKSEDMTVCMRNVSTATVNSAWLAYYSKAACDGQTYLKPVYVFEGEAEGKSIVENQNKTAHFKQFIVAAPELGGLYAEE